MDRFLEEFLTSLENSPEKFLDVSSVGDMYSPTLAVDDTDKIESAGSTANNYRQRLRSHSSFPATTSATGTITYSDTSSQAGGADVLDLTYTSDGVGSEQRRRIRRQSRSKRVTGSLFRSKNRTDGELELRPTYDCNVCGQTCLSPQSLGGHKNLHKNEGKNSKASSRTGSRRRFRAVSSEGVISSPGSNSSESSEGVPSPNLKGVRCREGTKWVSEIRPPKSSDKWWLGTFSSEEEAAQAYDVALCYFKSETELNYPLHDLCRNLPPVKPGLTRNQFALRLREMAKDVSEQIIADRRRQRTRMSSPSPSSTLDHEPAQPASSEATVSGDNSGSAAPDCIILDAPPTILPDFDPLIFLNCNDLTF